jgi:hypothetical protein
VGARPGPRRLPNGSSRELSAERLDRLHYFQAQLAAHGIHSDINLLVSRQFVPGDGLGAEIAQMTWKDQHVLGFFNEAALALQKEYATKLLTAPNPYRGGRSFATDPAVAFVEILNENGMLPRWYEGTLDTMPAVYREQLAQHWNLWLAGRYASTEALLSSWGAIVQPLQPSILTNGDFATGTTSWGFETHESARATATATSEFSGAPSVRLALTAAGSADWHVQFNQRPLSLAAHQVYTVSFWAKANTAVPLRCVVQRASGDYGVVGLPLTATLGTSWQRYTYTLQPEASDTNLRLNFGGFGDRLCTVWLADMRLQPGGSIGGLPEGRSLEARTIPSVARTTTGTPPSAEQRKDWIRYLLDSETRYWVTMERHIRESVGYPGILWGSIASNSPLNTQAVLTATDSHAYWQHPVWPAGQDWNLETWTVQNRSMVDDTTGGVLGMLAQQRVRGRPHNVTEYQHASPNTYASEGPLLAAAYGALQGWSSLWMFDYSTDEADYVTGFFDQGRHPGKMANSLLAAALFRRGDVAPAQQEYTMALTPEQGVEIAATTGSTWSVGDGAHLGVPATLALVSRLSLEIGASATGLPSPPSAPTGPVFTADTAELSWDNSRPNQGVVTVDTARSKAVIGHPADRTWNLGGVEIAPGTTRQNWCTVGIALLSGDTFDSPAGGRALVVTTGDFENTGQVWKNASRTSVGSAWGQAPARIEIVPATIVLPVAASRVAAWALDARGQRTTALTVEDSAGRARLVCGSNGATLWYEVEIRPQSPGDFPRIDTQSTSSGVVTGQASALAVQATGATAYSWFKGGVALPGTAGATLDFPATAPADAGLYDCLLTGPGGDTLSAPMVVGVVPASGERTVGSVTTRPEWQDIHHPNGATYDQFLLTGAAGTFTADPGQIARCSYLDENDSIVQVEMSGAGAITIVLDPATLAGPMAPALYNQSGIQYMRGKATIILAGADSTTHFTIYSVGTATNPGVTRADAAYAGWANVAAAGIVSTTGGLGGIHQGNVNYNATRGITGIYAPTVTSVGSLMVVHRLAASGSAQPYLYFGAGGQATVKIAGGALAQPNGDSITVGGLTRVTMGAGQDSCGRSAPAAAIQTRLVTLDGADVTAAVVTGP